MFKYLLQLACIAFVAFGDSIHAMDLKSIESMGEINRIDSVGCKNGLWVYADTTGVNKSTFICNLNNRGLIDGLWVALANNSDGTFKVRAMGISKDGLTQQHFDFYNDGAIAFIVDSVQPLNKEMFPMVGAVAERCKNTETGKYGIVQFYAKGYSQIDGSLEVEGWNCNYLDANNDFDYIADPLPIGIQKYYRDGKLIEKDETAWSIDVLLNMAGLGNDY